MMVRARALSALAGVTALAVLGACNSNQLGNLGTTKIGDTSHPATRGSPVDKLRVACGGEGVMQDGGTLSRQPYVQQVTATSAMIGWVSNAPEDERVVVTTPAGEVVAMPPASRDPAQVRRQGEAQMWSAIDGLSADTIYCYTIERGGVAQTTRIGFATAPTADSTRPIGVLAFGDSGGGGADQKALVDEMLDLPYEMIVHTGDLAYDAGSIAQIEDTVFAIYADLFRHIPFFPAAGNHDYGTSSGAPFRGVFALPDNGDSAGREQWYSYDWGRIHFAALDTESDYETQMTWLDADLAATSLPWKVVYLHRPPYSSGSHGSDTSLRSLLAPIVERHGVQLVLAGHDHDYERMKPQNGVQYIVTGGGGIGTRPVSTSGFTAFSVDVIHLVYLEFGTSELVAHAIDAEGNEFDSVVVPL